jgi:hypothetical protein
MAYSGPGVALVEVDHDPATVSVELVTAPPAPPLTRWQSFRQGWVEGHERARRAAAPPTPPRAPRREW